MKKERYSISEASRLLELEKHSLRNWEAELGLNIPRNKQGCRYYREKEIRMLLCIRDLKNKGFQLKAIKELLPELEREEKIDVHKLLTDRSRDGESKVLPFPGRAERAGGDPIRSESKGENLIRPERSASVPAGIDQSGGSSAGTERSIVGPPEIEQAGGRPARAGRSASVPAGFEQEAGGRAVRAEGSASVPAGVDPAGGSPAGTQRTAVLPAGVDQTGGSPAGSDSFMVEEARPGAAVKHVKRVKEEKTGSAEADRFMEEKAKKAAVKHIKRINEEEQARPVPADLSGGDNHSGTDPEAGGRAQPPASLPQSSQPARPVRTQGEKMQEFEMIMGRIVGKALLDQAQVMGDIVGRQVSSRVTEEVDRTLDEHNHRTEEYFKRLDDSIRMHQKARQEAAAARDKGGRKKSRFFSKYKKKI